MTLATEIYLARIEVRVERIERDIAEIKGDIRLLRGTLYGGTGSLWVAIIASDIVLAGLLAKGFGWL